MTKCVDFHAGFAKTVDGRNPAPVDRYCSLYPIIYKLLYIPGGAGFLPSSVCFHISQLF